MKKLILYSLAICLALITGCKRDPREEEPPKAQLFGGTIVIDNNDSQVIPTQTGDRHPIIDKIASNFGLKVEPSLRRADLEPINDYRFLHTHTDVTLTVDGVRTQASHIKIAEASDNNGWVFAAFNNQHALNVGGVRLYRYSLTGNQTTPVSFSRHATLRFPNVSGVQFQANAIDYHNKKLYIAGAVQEPGVFGFTDEKTPALFIVVPLDADMEFSEDITPVQLGSYQATSIRYYNGKIYVTSGDNKRDGISQTRGGLFVFDANNLDATPAFYELDDARSVDVNPTGVYVMQSTPNAIVHRFNHDGSYDRKIYEGVDDMQKDAKSDVFVWNNYLFLAQNQAGMEMVNRNNGELVFGLLAPNSEFPACPAGNTDDLDCWFEIEDVTNSMNVNSDPKKAFFTNGKVGTEDIRSDLLLVANGRQGLFWYEVRGDGAGSHVIVSSSARRIFRGDGSTNHVESRENIVFVACGLHGVKVLYIEFEDCDCEPDICHNCDPCDPPEGCDNCGVCCTDCHPCDNPIDGCDCGVCCDTCDPCGNSFDNIRCRQECGKVCCESCDPCAEGEAGEKCKDQCDKVCCLPCNACDPPPGCDCGICCDTCDPCDPICREQCPNKEPCCTNCHPCDNPIEGCDCGICCDTCDPCDPICREQCPNKEPCCTDCHPCTNPIPDCDCGVCCDTCDPCTDEKCRQECHHRRCCATCDPCNDPICRQECPDKACCDDCNACGTGPLADDCRDRCGKVCCDTCDPCTDEKCRQQCPNKACCADCDPCAPGLIGDDCRNRCGKVCCDGCDPCNVPPGCEGQCGDCKDECEDCHPCDNPIDGCNCGVCCDTCDPCNDPLCRAQCPDRRCCADCDPCTDDKCKQECPEKECCSTCDPCGDAPENIRCRTQCNKVCCNTCDPCAGGNPGSECRSQCDKVCCNTCDPCAPGQAGIDCRTQCGKVCCNTCDPCAAGQAGIDCRTQCDKVCCNTCDPCDAACKAACPDKICCATCDPCDADCRAACPDKKCDNFITNGNGRFATTLLTTGSAIRNGNVWMWGFRNSGQQGTGTRAWENSAIPRIANIPGQQGNIVAIAGGAYHMLALARDGRVYGWGQNGYGEVGVPTQTSIYNPTPDEVRHNGMPIRATMIAAGEYCSIALGSEGQVYTWGHGLYGQIGNGSRNSTNRTVYQVPLPAKARVVGAAYEGAFAVLENGTVWSWGDNEGSGLGFAGSIYAVQQIVSTPTEVVNLRPYAHRIVYIAGGNGWGQALLDDGSVIGWGVRSALGQNTTSNTSSATVVPILPNSEFPGVRVKQLFARYVGSAALLEDGRLLTWGHTAADPAQDHIYGSKPTVRNTQGAVAEVGGGKHHLFYLKTDGTFWGVGYNDLNKIDLNQCCHANNPRTWQGWPGVQIRHNTLGFFHTW